MAALKIIDRGDLSPSEMKGAWAGELGQTQFMAKDYYETAVDFDGNGKRNLIKSFADALASSAALLRKHGWRAGEPWLEEVKVPGNVPAANRPELPLMAPPPATTDQVGVIATTLPLASLPTAVNCWAAPMPRLAGSGVIVMLASAPALTVTVANPETPPLVALTVLVYVPGTVPAVNRPTALIVPPLATTDQVGVVGTTLPKASLPVAVNC